MSNILTNILIVGAGSCLGGMSRYALSRAIALWFHGLFPLPTLTVNILGCFIIGLIYGLIDRGCNIPDALRLFATVGFCGGFTTFSTFIHENYILFSGNARPTLILYLALSVIAGFAALFLAFRLAAIIRP